MDGRELWEKGDLCRRKTASDVDLNRNYDFAWQQQVRFASERIWCLFSFFSLPLFGQDKSSDMYGGEAPFSEPQAQYIRDRAAEWGPKAFINVHSGEWAIYTPWDSRGSMGAGLPVRSNQSYQAN